MVPAIIPVGLPVQYSVQLTAGAQCEILVNVITYAAAVIACVISSFIDKKKSSWKLCLIYEFLRQSKEVEKAPVFPKLDVEEDPDLEATETHVYELSW